MAQRVTWSATANADLRKLVTYLKAHANAEFAEKVADWYLHEIERLAEHPTKGMLIDRQRGICRWRLDRHNYVTYTVTKDGIVVKNILAYKQNRKGF